LNAAHAADVILYLLDASCAPSEEISAQLEKLMDGAHQERVVLVFNKADQGIHAEAHDSRSRWDSRHSRFQP